MPTLVGPHAADGAREPKRRTTSPHERPPAGQGLRTARRRTPLVRLLGRKPPVRRRGAKRPAGLLDRHPAAQRHRRSAHGPRPEQHPAGHPLPLPPPVRGQRAVDARHRPRRDRHPERGRAQAGPGRHGPARPRPRALHRRGLEVARGLRQRDHQPAQAARGLLRLGARALHHGRGPLARRAQGLRGALPRWADLPGRLHHQLVPPLPHGAGRSRGRARGDRRQPLPRALPVRGRARGRHHRRHHPTRDHAGRHGRGA